MIKNAVIVGSGITPEDYNSEKENRGSPKLVVSSHILGEILRNAQRWVKGYESPQSKALKFGSVFDCLLLTPYQWPIRYAVVPADAPRRPSERQINAKKPSPASLEAIAWWDRFTRDHPGEIISQEENASVHSAIARLREDKLISELIDCSRKQLLITAEWHDGPTGLIVPIKCLIDVVPPKDHPVFSNSLWDTKTTQNASPRSFSRDAMKYNYGIQGAFYLDLYNAATGEQRGDFGHVVIESFPPYEYRTPPPLLSQRFLGHGRLLYQRALAIYCKSVCSGVWPSYDSNSRDWPITDCDDWHLSMESVYDPFAEDEDTDEEPDWLKDPPPAEDAEVTP